MRKRLPLWLTSLRILLIPVLVMLFFIPGFWAAWSALLVYAIAAATDFLDGYLARRYQAVSAIGRFLDPLADKMFVCAVLFLLAAFNRLEGIWVIPAIIILLREFFVAGLREHIASKEVSLPVSRLAKWKTAIQMTAIGFLIVGPHNPWPQLPHMMIGWLGLTVAAGLTLYTGALYYLKVDPYLRAE